MTDVSADIHARVRELSDEEFFSMLLRSLDARVVQGTTFPSFPDDQLQANFVGSSGKDALNGVYSSRKPLRSGGHSAKPRMSSTSVAVGDGIYASSTRIRARTISMAWTSIQRSWPCARGLAWLEM